MELSTFDAEPTSLSADSRNAEPVATPDAHSGLAELARTPGWRVRPVVDHEPVPPREHANLSADDLVRLRAAVQDGKRPRVYLRDAVPSLGIAAASSAQVVSVQDGTVTVRPKGVGDDVPFESAELYASRAAAINAAATPAPRRPRAAQQNKPTPTPAVQAPPKKAPPGKTAATRVSVTISGGANGRWTVQSAHGSRKLGAPEAVAVDAVGRAVAELGDATAIHAVDAVRNHAQQAAAARVAELSAELERAQAALRALEHTTR